MEQLFIYLQELFESEVNYVFFVAVKLLDHFSLRSSIIGLKYVVKNQIFLLCCLTPRFVSIPTSIYTHWQYRDYRVAYCQNTFSRNIFYFPMQPIDQSSYHNSIMPCGLCNEPNVYVIAFWLCRDLEFVSVSIIPI